MGAGHWRRARRWRIRYPAQRYWCSIRRWRAYHILRKVLILMKYARPIPIRKTDEARLHRAVSEIIGRRLARVHYRYPHGTCWPEDLPYGHGQIDEVGMAAVADFDDGTSLIISWAMEGMSGGL